MTTINTTAQAVSNKDKHNAILDAKANVHLHTALTGLATAGLVSSVQMLGTYQTASFYGITVMPDWAYLLGMFTMVLLFAVAVAKLCQSFSVLYRLGKSLVVVPAVTAVAAVTVLALAGEVVRNMLSYYLIMN